MADRSITFDLLARDRASATFNKVGKSSDGLKGKVREFGSGFKDAFSPASVASVGALGAAVAGFGIASVKAYSEAQASQQKLTNAFQKFPQLADSNAAALRRLNEALATKTVYDDDATASAQATLAMFGLTEQQLRTLTPLLQDYASKTGKDLNTAATDLGKALDGQGRSLKAVGLDLDLTGTKAQNFDLIVQGLRKQVGGFAEKEGQTFDGKMQILNNRFGELQEKIGEKLLPHLITLADWLNETGIPTAEEMADKFSKWADRIGDVIRGLDKLAKKVPHVPGLGKGGGLGDAIEGAIKGSLPGLAILGFDSGGTVPGPRGAPQLALVHGGETILPTHKQQVTAGGKVELHMHAVEGASLGENADYAARVLGWRLGLAGGM